MNSDRIDYYRWCLNKLTVTEFGLYCIVLEFGEGLTTLINLGEIAGITPRHVSSHLQALRKKGFIQFRSRRGRMSNQDGMKGGGIEIFWIRKTSEESPPELPSLRKFVFLDPTGKKHEVFEGKLGEFANRHNLPVNGLSRLHHGRQRAFRGWKSLPMPTEVEA